MILTIDTEKERPEQLLRIARFLQELAGEKPSESSEVAEDFSFSQEAFSTVFDEPEDTPPQPKTASDDFRVQPY